MKKFLKATWRILSVTMKIILLLLLLLVLTPLGYFAWRAGQPMSLPEYDGRTYYELLVERRQAYDGLAQEYQASHPNVEVKTGMCFQVEMLVSLSNTLPWSGICAISEVVPGFRIYGERSHQLGCGQMGGTWLTLLDTWWKTFEVLLYNDILATAPQGPVPYCRLSAP